MPQPSKTQPEIPLVEPTLVLRCEYRLFDADGVLVEAPGSDEALELVVGSGPAASALELALSGARAGDTRRVQLGPGEAFGPRDESAVIRVERGELPRGAALGDEFEAESEHGETVFLRVIELDDESAALDANHPLSGQAVTLELSVLAVRAATLAEIAEIEARHARGGGESAPDVLSSRLVRKPRTGRRR